MISLAFLLGVQSKQLESAVLAKLLNLVNDFVSSIVTLSGQTLTVLVGGAASVGLLDCQTAKVLLKTKERVRKEKPKQRKRNPKNKNNDAERNHKSSQCFNVTYQ